jgi:hypothetical protein
MIVMDADGSLVNSTLSAGKRVNGTLQLVGITTLYLAAKVEECPLRLRELICTCHRQLHPDKAFLSLDDV